MWLAVALIAFTPGPQITLDAVGDVMLARWVGRRIEREGTNAAFAGVVREFKQADLVVGNLECALTSADYYRHKPILLRAKPSTLSALRYAGFSALSLANNHAQDCGQPGVDEARKLLTSAQIASVGPRLETTVLVRRRIRVGIIGLMDLPPDWLTGPPAWRDAVTALRQKSDVVVAMVHWGTEGSSRENARQTTLASQLAQAGVNLVLGSHPHVLQPVKWLPGPHGRRCLVAYSLGNFLFDARSGKERISEVLSVQLNTKGVVAYRKILVRVVRGFPILATSGHLKSLPVRGLRAP